MNLGLVCLKIYIEHRNFIKNSAVLDTIFYQKSLELTFLRYLNSQNAQRIS